MADDPVTCAIYARDNNLLDKPGWKHFSRITNRQKKLLRMSKQSKLRSYKHSIKYKYRFQVPRDYKEAIKLDKENGNKKLQEATILEIAQLKEYATFIDLGKGGIPPSFSKRISVHVVYDAKHDGRHKARLVADGNRTAIPIDSVYSGVASLRGIRLVTFLSELNGLELWCTDIGNAYLEAKTKEKVHIITGSAFGALEGHTFVISKALYGLRSLGLCWHERFSDWLRGLNFTPCKAELDIWMRENHGLYEYIAVYVDDLAIASIDPKSIVDYLISVQKFKLKATGPIKYHLGCDYARDEDGTSCYLPTKYIEKMIEAYTSMFGCKPKQNVSSPLEKGDHPELDNTEFLDDEGIQRYQSLIGTMQWAISLRIFDINTAIMSLSSFRTAPRLGHMERIKRVYGCISKMRHSSIHIRTEEPDYSDIPEQIFDWDYSIYGNVREDLPNDLPKALGKPVTLTHYVDANLYHDVMTGRSVTGILHLINKTPIDWYSKKQITVATSTYGSEFVAAKTCVDEVIEIRNLLCYLGVPINSKSCMFGDNRTAVDSSTISEAKIHKRHVMLSFHRV